MQKKLKPLAKGSRPQRGNISNSELSRVMGILKSALISWFKTNEDNWKNKHYRFLKSFNRKKLFAQIEKIEEVRV